MEEKTDALVLRSTEYKDNDKILTLLTAESGKITAGIKGVKRNGAKLKFAAEPFCFAEYVFATKANRNTVVSASLYDGFYSIREDIQKYYAACGICEVCNLILQDGMGGGLFFVDTVTALKNVCYAQPDAAVVRFLLRAIVFAGFTLDLGDCSACGKKLTGRVYFDFDTGRFFCKECKIGVAASECTYEYLKKCSSLPYNQSSITADAPKRTVKLLKTYLSQKTENEFSSLSEYIRMM